jgi:hypothetical protein
MDGEISGPGPEDLKPEDLAPSGDKQDTRSESLGISDEKLKGMADGLFKGISEEKQDRVVKETGRILEKYNFGKDLDDQFHRDIIQLAGETVGSKTHIPKVGKGEAYILHTEIKEEIEKKMAKEESAWVNSAYRLFRERQGNPVDQQETIRVMVQEFRGVYNDEKYDQKTKAISDKASDLLKRYSFGINPDVKFLEDIYVEAEFYVNTTNYELDTGTLRDKQMALGNKESLDKDEPNNILEIYNDYLARQGKG